ncbi:MAG: response regulator [Gammaproteobacteria bacterium]|nr:MAG: response regulator [Gammaproteobacteria bacterium]
MILLVEDSEDDATLISRVLAKQVPSSTIRVAHNGSEALELLSGWDGEELQLILLDVNLPQVSGLQVLKELRKSPLTRHVPVVMLSGSSNNSDVAQSYDLGANSFLNKADQAEHFEATIQQVVPYWLHLNHPCPSPGSTGE